MQNQKNILGSNPNMASQNYTNSCFMEFNVILDEKPEYTQFALDVMQTAYMKMIMGMGFGVQRITQNVIRIFGSDEKNPYDIFQNEIGSWFIKFNEKPNMLSWQYAIISVFVYSDYAHAVDDVQAEINKIKPENSVLIITPDSDNIGVTVIVGDMAVECNYHAISFPDTPLAQNTDVALRLLLARLQEKNTFNRIDDVTKTIRCVDFIIDRVTFFETNDNNCLSVTDKRLSSTFETSFSAASSMTETIKTVAFTISEHLTQWNAAIREQAVSEQVTSE